MDTLVAQYSRPAFENEGYSEQEQYELSQTLPPLSLNFAMPPIANVGFTFFNAMYYLKLVLILLLVICIFADRRLARSFPPSYDR